LFPALKFIVEIIKSKQKTKEKPSKNAGNTLNEELNEIKSQITKLKSFCSNKKTKRSISEERTDRKAMNIDELNCHSIKKSIKKRRDITPKVKSSCFFMKEFSKGIQ